MSSSPASPASSSLLQRAIGAGRSLTEALAWLPPILTRFVIGLVFVKTGWGKLHNLDQVIEFFRSLGIPAPEFQAPFAATMEFTCGLLVLVGLFTRLAAVPLMVIMIVAIATAFREQLGAADGAIESLNVLFGLSEFLYIVLLVWLVVRGAGAVSLDRVLLARAAR